MSGFERHGKPKVSRKRTSRSSPISTGATLVESNVASGICLSKSSVLFPGLSKPTWAYCAAGYLWRMKGRSSSAGREGKSQVPILSPEDQRHFNCGSILAGVIIQQAVGWNRPATLRSSRVPYPFTRVIVTLASRPTRRLPY